MQILLKGGTVVSGDGCRETDILIQDEKIQVIGQDLAVDADEIIDVTGRLLFPGFIDAHTHFDLHVAGTVTADDFASGTQAALAGGTTAIVDFATQYQGETLEEGIANWHKKADGKASCDYGFHLAITDWNSQASADVPKIMEDGVTSFKLYLTYDTMVNDEELYEILVRLRETGGIVGVHCENDGVIKALVKAEKAAGHNAVSCHPKTRPAAMEAEAVARLLKIARVAEAPVIVVHLSTKEGLTEILHARKDWNQEVYVETCPQYLLMDDSRYQLPGFEGARYVIAPPLRKPADQEALWKALSDGGIQTVSTDHCSFTLKQKELGLSDFTKIPGGMPGVETRPLLMYTYGVCEGRVTLPQMCRQLAENPAKLYGMFPQKGVLAPGSDADITVLNPNAETVLTAAGQVQHVDYAPFEGRKMKAKVEKVFLRGTLAAENGKVTREGLGRYVKRGRYQKTEG